MTAYETDYVQWIENQSRLISSANYSAVDWANLLEELEELGDNRRERLEGLLEVLMMHLLMYQFWGVSKGSWASEIDAFRSTLNRLLRRSPSLRKYLEDIKEDTYSRASKRAWRKSGILFPPECPYTTEQLLDDDWLP